MTTKVLAVSDNVLPYMQDAEYLKRTYSDVRLLISCGDMSATYLDVIGSILGVPLFYVRGNHDTRYEPGRPGGDNLHQHIRKFDGFSFVGLEGSIRYNRGPIQSTQSEMFTTVLHLLPRLMLMRSMRGYGVDVMVVHSPPWGIHDIPDDPAHQGFKAFLYLMRWACPRYLIHGHIDTWDNRKPTETMYARTQVININPVRLLPLDRP